MMIGAKIAHVLAAQQVAPIVFSLALSACVQASANLPADAIATISAQVAQSKILVADLQSADWDAHQAVTVGALDASDPLPGCLDAVETELGVIGPVSPSFVPKRDGLISVGVMAYVRTQQLLKIQGGGQLNIPPSCDAVFGKVMREAMAAGLKFGAGGLAPIP